MKSNSIHRALGRALMVLSFLAVLWQPATAQSSQVVKGTVTDTQGQPLVGVTVSVQGASAFGTTDSNGNYSINVPAPKTASLEYMLLGM